MNPYSVLCTEYLLHIMYLYPSILSPRVYLHSHILFDIYVYWFRMQMDQCYMFKNWIYAKSKSIGSLSDSSNGIYYLRLVKQILFLCFVPLQSYFSVKLFLYSRFKTNKDRYRNGDLQSCSYANFISKLVKEICVLFSVVCVCVFVSMLTWQPL